MNATNIQNARLLGFVQVQIGAKTFALPVQAVHFERDGEGQAPAGGFFTEEAGQYGSSSMATLPRATCGRRS